MNGGCQSRKRTAASIQLKAYWPSWLSDLNAFLKECQPCSRNHRKSAHRKVYFHTLRESGRMTPRKMFRGHEINVPIDEMGRSPDRANVATETRDGFDSLHNDAAETRDGFENLHNDAVEACEKSCSSVKRRKRHYDVKVKSELKPFDVHVDKPKRCPRPTPATWVSGKSE